MWGGQRTSKILTPPWSLVRPQILASSNATSQVKDSQHIRLESRIFSERCDKFAQVATSEVSVRSTRTKMFPTKCHKINRMKLLQKVSLSFPSFEWVSIYQCHSEASTEFQFMPWSIDSVIDLDYQKSEKNSPIQAPRMLLRTRCWGFHRLKLSTALVTPSILTAEEMQLNFPSTSTKGIFCFNTEGPWKEGLVWNQYQYA